MVSKSKSSSKSPSLTKGNKAKINTLALSRKLGPDALALIAKHLKKGDTVWFGPDQDMGPKGSVFAPFFGRPACTVTTPSRLARISGAISIFLDLHRDFEGVYHLSFVAMPDNYPCEDEVENAYQLNQYIEKTVRNHPSQYMWMHKRFKTSPDLTNQTLYQPD